MTEEALSAAFVAAVGRANVTVVTGFANSRTGASAANIGSGAGILVVARQSVVGMNTSGEGITAVGGAGIFVVAIQGLGFLTAPAETNLLTVTGVPVTAIFVLGALSLRNDAGLFGRFLGHS